MVVTHLAKFYPPVPGGMERVVESLCRVTRGQVDNRVLAFHTGPGTVREFVDGVPVTRVGTPLRAGSVPLAPGFFRELDRCRTDLFVVHEPNPWALLACAIVRPKAPLLIWYHSDVVRPKLQYALFYSPVARPVYRRAVRFVVSSPPLAEHSAALAPFAGKTTVIPFGIDPADSEPTADVAERAAQLRGGLNGRPLLLFAGRLVAYKGVDVLLRSLQDLDVVAVIAGNGPRREEWMALAQRLGLNGRVRFAGEVPAAELAALYHACDIFVLPSVTRAEAFGFVQLEAMACGKPVVSTRVPSGVPWVNRDGETGLTVPPGDPAALAAAIAQLAADPELRSRMGAAGRHRAASEFSASAMGEQMMRLYRDVLDEVRR